jgi:Zn-dependent peptidase ImmA (M78 family)
MAVFRRAISTPRPPIEYDPRRAARDAHKIAETFTLVTTPLDAEGLASTLGLKIVRMPMASGTSGFLRQDGTTWIIGVNSLHHPNRQRFTIAHEIGHYMLHRDHAPFEDGLLFRNENTDGREREANQFAALLLMPEAEFKIALEESNIDEVAKKFKVSSQAAEYRRDRIVNQIGID